MKKGLIIKVAIVLVVLTLSYCVFWFFKVGQSEKQINKFIVDNSSNISAGEIAVSGFPLSQKITINDLKITVPVSLVAKRQIHIKQVEAKAGIFSSNFTVLLKEGVKVQDLENSGEMFDIEFVNQPEIMISLANGIISKFQYNDVGFKIVDTEKNTVNSSTGTSIISETSIDETEKRTNKINISFKELEGYTILDFYKNVLEKKVIEGIKTEEIKISTQQNSPTTNEENKVATNIDSKNQTNPNNKDAGTAKADSKATDSSTNPTTAPIASAIDATKETPKNGLEAAKQVMEANKKAIESDPNYVATNAQTNNQPNSTENIAKNEEGQATTPEAISDSSIIKSNVVINLVITLTPSIKQEREAPSDPTQIQELPVQFVQNLKIENFEFSNPLYKISASGDLVSSSDDNFPSGTISLRVEKIPNLLQQLKTQFKQLAETKKSSIPESGSDLGAEESQVNYVNNYDIFLSNVSEKIQDVVNEISSKNSVSKDDISQFDIRREKNLEFLVNEVPVREIVGKF